MTTAHITILPSGVVILDDGLFAHERRSLWAALAYCRRQRLGYAVHVAGPCAPEVVAWAPELLVL